MTGRRGALVSLQEYLKLKNERIVFLVEDRSCGEFWVSGSGQNAEVAHNIYREDRALSAAGELRRTELPDSIGVGIDSLAI